MGITGLLTGLKPFTREASVLEFSKQSIAVDTSSWLHKSVYSMASRYVELLEKGQHCRDKACIEKSSEYIVGRCQELIINLKLEMVYLVMDGRRSPLKAPTNQDREQKRQQSLAEARAIRRRSGTKESKKLFDSYKSCIKITDDFARVVINHAIATLRRKQIHQVCVIYSPYEADAQLVELCKSGMAQAVITEDSDVLVYSAACDVVFPVIFKLDRESGRCHVMDMSWLLDSIERKRVLERYRTSRKQSTPVETCVTTWMQYEEREKGMGRSVFVSACVFADCDYAPNSLQGVGLANAFKLIDRNKQKPNRFREALRQHQMSRRAGALNASAYEAALHKAELVFYHHPVKKHPRQTIEYITPLHNGGGEMNSRLEEFRDGGLEAILGSLNVQVAPNATITKPATLHKFLRSAPQSAKSMKKPSGKENKPTIIKKPAVKNIMANPYLKKQQTQTQSKKCETKKPRDPKAPIKSVQRKPDPVANGKENGIAAKVTCKRKDLRFVKPQFSKDGSRITTLDLELPTGGKKPSTSSGQAGESTFASESLRPALVRDMINQDSGRISLKSDVQRDPPKDLERDGRSVGEGRETEPPSADDGKLFGGDSTYSTDAKEPEGAIDLLCSSPGGTKSFPSRNVPDSVSVDDLSEPSNQTTGPTTSRFFSSKSAPVRRVTIEDVDSKSASGSLSPKHDTPPQSPTARGYDDFFSPNKQKPLDEDDEIEDYTPEIVRVKSKKTRATTGPAKTNNKNGLGGDGKRKGSPLLEAFERQRKQGDEDNAQVRNRYSSASSRFSKRRRYSNTLLAYFEPTQSL